MALVEKVIPEETASGDVPSRRRASKEFRRDQLINATIDTLFKKGFAATTLADVADGANLSRGIVNFHFESKEKLLRQTLEYIGEAYARNWKEDLTKALGLSAAKRMHVLVSADLNKNVCTPRLIAAWFGFYTEAQNRPAFRDLCWARDDEYLAALHALCAELKSEGSYTFDPEKTAAAIYAVQEGLWLRLMLGSKSLKRESALDIALTTLGTMFPAHFSVEGVPRK